MILRVSLPYVVKACCVVATRRGQHGDWVRRTACSTEDGVGTGRVDRSWHRIGHSSSHFQQKTRSVEAGKELKVLPPCPIGANDNS